MTDRLVPYDLGQTAVSGELEHLLGHKATFADQNKDSVGAKPLQSAMSIEAMWCKWDPTGTTTLPAGTIVSWKAAYAGQRCAAVAGAKAAGAGVADPYCSSVAAGEHFWLIREGPADVISSGTGIADGALMTTAASGQVGTFSASGTKANEASSLVGVSMAASGIAATKHRAIVSFRY